MTEWDYDLFVIGAGSGGVRAARMSAQYGARVAVAEQKYLGGTCVNMGCIPKKLFVYAAEYHENFMSAAGFGWQLEPPAFAWRTLRDNKNAEISRLNQIYRDLLSNAGVNILDGRAVIVDPHTVAINGSNFSCKYILITSGGVPYVPEFPGREHVFTSDDMFYLEALPKRLVIVGGGYIAVEFAGIMQGLGVQTDLVYRGPLFLKRFDQDLRELLAEEMQELGVKLHFNCDVTSVEKNGEGLHIITEGGQKIEADGVLYATGRRPNTTGLGLENTAVTTNTNGAIVVNDKFFTKEPSILALGDVIGRVELTPVAIREGMIVASTLFNEEQLTMDYQNIATAVFSNPNLSTVGLTEAEARQKYAEIAVYKTRFRPLKETLGGGKQRTFMKLVVDTVSDRVLGCHMLGHGAAEIIQGLAVAIKAGATKKDFDTTVGIHPTTAEEFVTMRAATTLVDSI